MGDEGIEITILVISNFQHKIEYKVVPDVPVNL
jgi:hypothetical protein